MKPNGFIPPQIHTFCMETVDTDITYVASRLYYAALAAGQETANLDAVNRTKYEQLAKALIPTLSIRRANPMAEGQVCKTLGSTPPVPNHEPFQPVQYKDVPTAENTQHVAEEAAAKEVPPAVKAPTVVTSAADTPPVKEEPKKEVPSEACEAPEETPTHLD